MVLFRRSLLLVVRERLFSLCVPTLILAISLQPGVETISSILNQAENLEYENPDSAIAIYRVAQRLALQKDSLTLAAKSTYYTGLVHMQQGRFDTCQYYLDIAYEMYYELGDKEYEYKVKIAVANNLNYQGKFEGALKAYQIALGAAEAVGNLSAQSIILSNQSTIFHQTGRIESAIKTLNKSLQITLPLGETNLLADIYNNLSTNYQTFHQYDSAIHFVRLAIGIHRQMNDHAEEALVLSNLSAYLHEMNPPQFVESKKALDRTRSILDTIKLPGVEINYWKHLAYYLYKNRSFSEAEEATGTCLEFLSIFPDPKSEATVYEILYSINKETENIGLALNYYEKYTAIRDSLLFSDTRQQLQELQAIYESTKKDNEIVAQNLTISRRTGQRNLLMAGLASFGLLIWFLSYRQQKNKLFNEEKIANLENHQKILVMDSMLQGQEKERKRIAQDLHDGLGTILAAARMQMQVIQREVDKMGELNLVDKTEKLIAGACLEVRRISHDMMPSALSDLGFVAATEDLVDEIKMQRALIFQLDLPEELKLQDGMALNLYRIIQEILQNTVKHANANIVELSILEENDFLFIRIFDDGIGIDSSNLGDGIGLSNIRSRVHYLNGKLTIGSDNGVGCLFEIWLPISKEYSI